ncbi:MULTISPECIES: hypothetical protein [unclassified Caballeronia]|uniref:hypothetical protein n=1 Tax=unclassified Caballeronia TaxID=2646786 RepID=UPI002864B86D|nr:MULTISPECIES: hypothetical protein [unclassified Caballeronia]MDR5749990.1 hypothetical protein [Caballeronia sp. LZ024]MDR5842882.1 hypothetical protein [Caballeronia sp. LZ031]
MTLKTVLTGVIVAASAFAAPLAACAEAHERVQQQAQQQAPSPQSLAMEGARTCGNIARGAADVCHIDAAKIERFKTAARQNFAAAPDFDGAWKLGYTEAQSAVDRFARLKSTDPAEYAKEIHEACPALNRGIDEVTNGK